MDVVAESVFTIDETIAPPTIDMTYEGRPALGIYCLLEDRLTICLSDSTDERPTRFVSEADSPNRMLIHLRRRNQPSETADGSQTVSETQQVVQTDR